MTILLNICYKINYGEEVFVNIRQANGSVTRHRMDSKNDDNWQYELRID